MSRNSRNRDLYRARIMIHAGDDPVQTAQLFTTSPYKSHRKKGGRIKLILEMLDKIKERENVSVENDSQP